MYSVIHPMRRSVGLGIAALLAGTVLSAAAPARSPAPAAASATSVVQVNTGQGRLVTLARPMSDLFIADDAVADVQVRSPTQLYVFGKKPGETTVSATTKSGAVVYAATVRVGNNIGSIGSMLQLAMPDAKIVATPMNGLVLLTGTVANPDDAAEAERLTQAFVGETTKVLSRLKTATPLQVNLQVRIAEVSRSFAKNVGVNLTSRDNSGGFLFGIGQGRQGTITTVPGIPGLPTNPVDVNGARAGDTLYGFPAAAAVGTTVNMGGKLLGLDLLSAIDLGETMGQVTTLANPNLTSLSGETATFLAGGEIPIPIAQTLGTISVEYKQYGVSLAYTPTVLSNGRISLRVRPEVSELSDAGAITLNNTKIPALTTRRAETTVELGSGQSLMIGGLLQNKHNSQITRAPGIGNLPILGALFRSNAWQRNETELVIVVTPYLVKPVDNPGDIKLPTDGYKAPTDLGRVFLGQTESGQSGLQRPVPTMAPQGYANPAVGVAAPTGPAPLAPRSPVAVDTKAAQPKKGVPAPGFSN